MYKVSIEIRLALSAQPNFPAYYHSPYKRKIIGCIHKKTFNIPRSIHLIFLNTNPFRLKDRAKLTVTDLGINNDQIVSGNNSFFYSCDRAGFQQIIISEKPTVFTSGKANCFVIILVNPTLGRKADIPNTRFDLSIFPDNLFCIVGGGTINN